MVGKKSFAIIPVKGRTDKGKKRGHHRQEEEWCGLEINRRRVQIICPQKRKAVMAICRSSR